MSLPPEDPSNRTPIEFGSCPNLSLESLDDLWPLILQETSTGNNKGPTAGVFLDQQDQYLAQTDQYPSFPDCDILSYPPEIPGSVLQKIAIPGECSTSSPLAAATVERNNYTNDELMLELAKSRDLGVAGSSKSVMSFKMTEMTTGMIRENKKEDHNAKERMRRKNLNAFYSTLADFLPHSPSSKKRRGAPAIIDGVVEYIPEIKKEIES